MLRIDCNKGFVVRKTGKGGQRRARLDEGGGVMVNQKLSFLKYEGGVVAFV